jgi:hypothetical protein
MTIIIKRFAHILDDEAVETLTFTGRAEAQAWINTQDDVILSLVETV